MIRLFLIRYLTFNIQSVNTEDSWIEWLKMLIHIRKCWMKRRLKIMILLLKGSIWIVRYKPISNNCRIYKFKIALLRVRDSSWALFLSNLHLSMNRLGKNFDNITSPVYQKMCSSVGNCNCSTLCHYSQI